MQDNDRNREAEDVDRSDRSEGESSSREDRVRAAESEEMRGAGESDPELEDTDEAVDGSDTTERAE